MRYVEEVNRAAAANKQSAAKREGVFLIYYFFAFYFHVVFATSAIHLRLGSFSSSPCAKTGEKILFTKVQL
jgi:hypothetical protein